jgi:outer membrane protein assembly factor BamB
MGVRLRPLALALFALAYLTGSAVAEEFTYRVDLQTGAVAAVGPPNVGRQARPANFALGWWKTSPGGRKPAVTVQYDFNARNLWVLDADGQKRMRVSLPTKKGSFIWQVIDDDALAVAWRSSNGHDGDTELSGPEHVWRVGFDRKQAVKRQLGGKTQRATADGFGRILVEGPTALRALDIRTLDVLWTLPRGSDDHTWKAEFCPVSSKRWLVGTSSLVALDATSGEVAWRATVAAEHGDALVGWCLVQGDRALVMWRTGVYARAEKQVVVAYDAATGRVLWSKRFADPAHQAIAVGSDELGVWFSTGIARVDWRDGQILWTLPGVGPSSINRLPDGDWFLPEGGCARVDARTGIVRWRLGEPCLHVGEDLLLTAPLKNTGPNEWTVSLRQSAFSDQRLLREDVVHRYSQFVDEIRASVLDSYRGRDGPDAIVRSELIVLE